MKTLKHATVFLLVIGRILLATAADVIVGDDASLRNAIVAAAPGTQIRILPGLYKGGMHFREIHGSANQPIVIRADDPRNPPRIMGGGNAFHFVNATYLELRDLVLGGTSDNGLNIDDGGDFNTPAHHVVLRNLTIQDVGPTGNCDGIKLSGVTDFRIENCRIERWGDAGQGIDLVGCHRGIIEGNTLRHGRPHVGGVGVQAKGGSSEIIIRRNRFEHAGARGVNIGGSTGLPFFRPEFRGYEAHRITVEGNCFIGSVAPVAFVGADDARVRYNTIYHPEKWALRILQENRMDGFVPCRNGVFECNIVIFRSDRWSEGGVNIGPHTAPETFRFSHNMWFCEDQPDRSRPRLPADVTEEVYGQDPKFRDPSRGDFTPLDGSPAEGYGATALPAP